MNGLNDEGLRVGTHGLAGGRVARMADRPASGELTDLVLVENLYKAQRKRCKPTKSVSSLLEVP